MIRTLLFDLDETLIVERGAFQDALAATCARFAGRGRGASIAAADLVERVQLRRREFWQRSATLGYCDDIGISSWEGMTGPIPRPRGAEHDSRDHAALASWLPTYRRETWSAALADLGVTDEPLVAELVADLVEERNRHHTLYDDSVPALDRLAVDYQLAIVTNGASEIQRQKLVATGMDPRISVLIVSGEVGAGKPDPRPYHAALDALGAEVGSTAMIGDSLISDMPGANRVGLKAIWIDRLDVRDNRGIRLDARIERLNELAAVLAEL